MPVAISVVASATERLTYFRGGLKKKGPIKRYAKVLELVGRWREKYPRASKAFEIAVIPAESKHTLTLAPDIVGKKRTACEERHTLDGCSLWRTDREDLSDAEIGQTYLMLTRVETAFRALKSSLGSVPFFIKRMTARTHTRLSRCSPIPCERPSSTGCAVLETPALGPAGGKPSPLISGSRSRTARRPTTGIHRTLFAGAVRPKLSIHSFYERLPLNPQPLPRRRYVGT